MIEVWSRIPNAQNCPWLPITANGNMINYFLQKLQQYPQMAFIYQGKPLLLAVGGSFGLDPSRNAELSPNYTIKTMWAFLNADQVSKGHWSFMQPCQSGFKNSKGDLPCGQQITGAGAFEQISVTAAYQQTYMSNVTTAVPKFQGKTFLRQLETAFNLPNIPIVTHYWME